MNNSPRIQPLEPPFSPEAEALLSKWMRPGSPQPVLALFRTMARNPELMGRMRALGAGLLGKTSSLDPRDREIVIDRVCARCACEYEWGVHAAIFGSELGLSKETLHATVLAPATDPVWTPRQALLIRLVDALHESARVTDELWADLSAQWNEAQCLELLILVGWYHVISFVANGARVPLESWAERFPGGTSE